MSAIPDLLSFATTLVVIGLVIAAVMKVFQIAANVEEMKEILKESRRAANAFAVPHSAAERPAYTAQTDPPPYSPQPYPSSAGVSALAAALPVPEAAPFATPAQPQPLPAGAGLNFTRPPTAEELVRAIHAQDFRGDDLPL